MSGQKDNLRSASRWSPARLLAPLGATIPYTIFAVTALSLPLTAAQALNLTAAQTTSWIAILYGIPGLLSLFLATRYRQPLPPGWTVSAVIFVASFAGQVSYPELLGASLVAGVVVVLLGLSGLSGQLITWFPAPIVSAMLAGALLPYVANIFSALGTAPAVVGSVFVTYLLGRRLLPARIPAILPTVIMGFIAAALNGQINVAGLEWSWPTPDILLPAFSLEALIAATPVLTVLILMQSNVPALVFIRSQGYHPPERSVNVLTGLGTMVGSFFGVTPVCLGAIVAPMLAGPEAGEPEDRHWTIYFSGIVLLLIAALAGIAAEIPQVIPFALLSALAGLALVGVVANTLQDITHSPLKWGPLFAFATAVSDITLFDFGPLFWSLVLGLTVSIVLEPDALAAVRQEAQSSMAKLSAPEATQRAALHERSVRNAVA